MRTRADRIHAALIAESDPARVLSIPSPAPLPSGLLPEPFAAWAAHTARLAYAPEAAITLSALAGAGALLGPNLALRLQPGWIERPTLWVALIGPILPTVTRALQHALTPFITIHTRAETARQQQLDRIAGGLFRQLEEIWASLDRPPESDDILAQPAPRARPSALDTAPVSLEILRTIESVTRTGTWGNAPRLFASSLSVNALLADLVGSPALTIVHPDLAPLLIGSGRDQSTHAPLLRALWSTAALEFTNPVAEYSRGRHIVGLLGGIEPHRLPRLAMPGPDALLECLIPVFPKQQLPPPVMTHDPPARDANDRITTCLDTLAQALQAEPASFVEWTPSAAARWAAWLQDHLAAPPAGTVTGAAFARNLPAQAARLTLVLHSLWHHETPHDPVTADTLDRALALVATIRTWIDRLLWIVEPSPGSDHPVDALATRITATLGPEWTARTALAIALGRPETAHLTAAINHLEHTNVIETRIREPLPGHGRPTTEYRLATP